MRPHFSRMGVGVALTALITFGGGTLIASSSQAAPLETAPGFTAYCTEVVEHSGNVDYRKPPLQNTAGWCLMQKTARIGGYTGPINGTMGPNSWKGLQTFLKKNHGYSGNIDGEPGPLTYKALQRWAKDGGYTGSVNGVMTNTSWADVNYIAKIEWGASD